MSIKLTIFIAICSLCVGLITGVVLKTSHKESKNAEIERIEQDRRLLQQLSEARAGVSILKLLEKKDYKKIEDWQLYILDRHYDNLVAEQSIRNQIDYESGEEWKNKTEKEKSLFDIKSFLLDAKQYENRLPSRNIPKKPSYPIEKAVADLLENKKQTIADFGEHLNSYLYRKWLDYENYQTFISYESEEIDPSPGPEIILFFHKDRLYAVLQRKEVPYESFVREIMMSDYKVSYLFRLNKELEDDFDEHFRTIISVAD